MLPANKRLKKGLFNNVYRRGKREYGKAVSLFYMTNGSRLSQFGFVVSKKNAPKAFQRNRIKRTMREAVHVHLKDILGGYNIILTFISKCANYSINEERKNINKEIELLFLKARLKIK
jgi:ribonuclease P protein component